jgi:hypothetical protein
MTLFSLESHPGLEPGPSHPSAQKEIIKIIPFEVSLFDQTNLPLSSPFFESFLIGNSIYRLLNLAIINKSF